MQDTCRVGSGFPLVVRYASMDDFELFTALTQLYLLRSFSETAHRLAKPELAGSFLLCDRTAFGKATQEICEAVVNGANGRGWQKSPRRLSRSMSPALRIQPSATGTRWLERSIWCGRQAGFN